MATRQQRNEAEARRLLLVASSLAIAMAGGVAAFVLAERPAVVVTPAPGAAPAPSEAPETTWAAPDATVATEARPALPEFTLADPPAEAEPPVPTPVEAEPPVPTPESPAPPGPPASVAAVVKRNARDVAGCWERSATKPAGRWELAWTITRDGTVRDARVVSSPPRSEAGLSLCIVAAVLTWRFDAQAEEVEIASYPFVFAEG
jgi:hypothetical protein